MKFLNPPIPEVKPEDIFKCCVESYRDLGKKKRLLACQHLVEVDSASYQELVPSQIDRFTISKLPRKQWASACDRYTGALSLFPRGSRGRKIK